MGNSKGLTVTTKIPEGVHGPILIERLSLVYLGVFTAYEMFSSLLRDTVEHVELKPNRHQDDIRIRFILRAGDYRLKTEPWEVVAETGVLFNFTPDITAQELAERIYTTVKSALCDYRKRVDRQSFILGELIA